MNTRADAMTSITTVPPSPERPHPHTARDHVRLLHAAGGTYRAIGAAAGVGPMTVHDIAAGRRRPTGQTTAAVLAVPSRAVPRARIDAGGTRLRLRALHVMGHGSARLARAAGASEQTIRKLVRGGTRTVSPRLRDTVAAVYDAWWDKRAPERTRAERAAASAARRRAIAGNWCAGAGLDDDELDIPGYRPGRGWRPARGTGVAADITPRAPEQATADAAVAASPRAARHAVASDPAPGPAPSPHSARTVPA